MSAGCSSHRVIPLVVKRVAPTSPRTHGRAHEGGYWNEHWPDYQRFYVKSLARCR